MRPNPEDGRSKRVWITEAGRAFREEAIASLRPDIARPSARLDEGVLAALVGPLAEIRRILDGDRAR